MSQVCCSLRLPLVKSVSVSTGLDPLQQNVSSSPCLGQKHGPDTRFTREVWGRFWARTLFLAAALTNCPPGSSGQCGDGWRLPFRPRRASLGGRGDMSRELGACSTGKWSRGGCRGLLQDGAAPHSALLGFPVLQASSSELTSARLPGSTSHIRPRPSLPIWGLLVTTENGGCLSPIIGASAFSIERQLFSVLWTRIKKTFSSVFPPSIGVM